MNLKQLTLREILNRIHWVKKAGETPVVIFDLDFTLFDNAPRCRKILQILAETHKKSVPVLKKGLKGLPEDLPYDHSDILELAGIDRDHERHAELKSEMGDMFFSSDYLAADQPIPGSVDYVGRVLKAGALVVYLTGRDRIGMYPGTVASLKANGFPVGHPQVHLYMKPDQVTKDWNFKAKALSEVSAYGTLVALFDNEPANVNTYLEAHPDILAVLLETKCAPNPPKLHPEAITIVDFQMPVIPPASRPRARKPRFRSTRD